MFALDGGQLFGLHTHPEGLRDAFDEHRTGLDHVSFGCPDRAALESWIPRLDELGVKHGRCRRPYGLGLSFRDPDGIALEVFAPPA